MAFTQEKARGKTVWFSSSEVIQAPIHPTASEKNCPEMQKIVKLRIWEKVRKQLIVEIEKHYGTEELE